MESYRHLPELELEIILAIWGLGDRAAAPRIQERLGRPLTASALHTCLKRLEKKGYLSCEKAGKGNLYIKKKNSGALVCAVLAAAILGGSLVSCTGEAPEQGKRYTHDLSEQWAGITDLYLSVALGEESMDIDLLTDIAGIVPSEWADGLSVGRYIRDAGGFGGGFYILLRANGTFEYYEGGLSSYIGMGTWTYDGETLCLADRVLEDSFGIQYYYFKVAEGALIFQMGNSAEFMYLDVADGERFSLKPRPGYFAPDTE